MFWYKAAFGLCLLLLLTSYRTLAAAQKKCDRRQVRVLHLLRIGLGFSALSYGLRLLQPTPAGHISPSSFLACLLGTAFIWMGWMAHWRLRWERLHSSLSLHKAVARSEAAERNEAGAPPAAHREMDLPRLTPRVQQILDYAQDEAQRRGHGRVDTEHLLLGLLREPCNTGVIILEHLSVNAEKVHLDLLASMGPRRNLASEKPRVEPSLTEEAHQVLTLAAQEAHRFDTTYVATEHLLLGLLLAGKGKAASVLFGEGITVAGIHAEILKVKNTPSHRTG